MRNQQWRLRRYPQPDELIGDEHFTLVDGPIPNISADEFLVRTLVLGTSPAQRGYLDPRNVDLVQPGDIMRGRGIGVVEASNHPAFTVGDWVNASTGWQQWSVQRSDRAAVQSMQVQSIQRVDRTIGASAMHLGTLGSAGFAALYGMDNIGRASAGQTVVVTAAAGGVGSMACQIAKALQCRVVGVTGSDRKGRWLTETLGCDAAINYKTQNLADQLQAHCPQGIDVLFDNVGGSVLDQALMSLAMHARVVICGYIATNYQKQPAPGPANYKQLLRCRARMEGFVIWDHVQLFPELLSKLQAWYSAGQILSVEDIEQGIERMPGALQSLFTGGNQGVKLVQVSPDPS